MIDTITPATQLTYQLPSGKHRRVSAIEVLEGARVKVRLNTHTSAIVPFARLSVECPDCNGEGLLYIDTTRRWDDEPHHRTEDCLTCGSDGWLTLDEFLSWPPADSPMMARMKRENAHV